MPPAAYIRDLHGEQIDGILSFAFLVERNGVGTIDITANSSVELLTMGGLARGWVHGGTAIVGVEAGLYVLTTRRRQRGNRKRTQRTDEPIQWSGITATGYKLQRTFAGQAVTGPGVEDNNITYADKTVGQILLGMLPATITATFTATRDSDGELWDADATPPTFVVAPTDSLADVLDQAVDETGVMWRPSGSIYLDIYNPGTRRDLSVTNPPVEIEVGHVSVQDAPQNESMVDAATVCLVSGAPGHVVTVNRAADYPVFPWPTAACAISVPEVTSSTVLDRAGRLEIKRRMLTANGHGAQSSQVVQVNLTRDDVNMPGLQYDLGDRVLLSAGPDKEAPIVDSWVLTTKDDPTQIQAYVNFGDRLEAEVARITRRLAAIERRTRKQPV